jgi:hypothetical protein
MVEAMIWMARTGVKVALSPRALPALDGGL